VSSRREEGDAALRRRRVRQRLDCREGGGLRRGSGEVFSLVGKISLLKATAILLSSGKGCESKGLRFYVLRVKRKESSASTWETGAAPHQPPPPPPQNPTQQKTPTSSQRGSLWRGSGREDDLVFDNSSSSKVIVHYLPTGFPFASCAAPRRREGGIFEATRRSRRSWNRLSDTSG